MATQAQIDANRRNAQKSTGPRTPAGKARSSRNSLIHGLTAQKHFLSGEDSADLAGLLERFRAEWQPATQTQESLVERMAAAHWRLRHFVALEAGIFNLTLEMEPLPECFNQQGRTDPLAWAFHVNCVQGDEFSRLARYEAHLQRDFSRCLRELQKLKADRQAETETSGVIAEINRDEANPIPENGTGDAETPHPAPRPQPPGAKGPLPAGGDPMSSLGPPPRWTDFAPELQDLPAGDSRSDIVFEINGPSSESAGCETDPTTPHGVHEAEPGGTPPPPAPSLLPSGAKGPQHLGPKAARNKPCPCGSGKKFKRCCLGKTGAPLATSLVVQ